MAAISDSACRYVGVDLHKQTITIAVVEGTRKLVSRKRLSHLQTDAILAYLKSFMPLELVVEATAGWPRRRFGRLGDAGTRGHSQLMFHQPTHSIGTLTVRRS